MCEFEQGPRSFDGRDHYLNSNRCLEMDFLYGRYGWHTKQGTADKFFLVFRADSEESFIPTLHFGPEWER